MNERTACDYEWQTSRGWCIIISALIADTAINTLDTLLRLPSQRSSLNGILRCEWNPSVQFMRHSFSSTWPFYFRHFSFLLRKHF